jgi:predicted glycosyltransferase
VARGVSRRVFLYVQHLLGIGHLKRASTLAAALARAGLEVTLASGGPPVAGLPGEGVRLAQLPPARAADLTFKVLLDEADRPVDDAWRERRRDALLGAWRASAAEVLLVELFPFGRRQMRFELLPLLEAAAAARPRALILCSVRDLLGAQKSAKRQAETLALLERYFDGVLVHGDQSVIGFEHSFPFAAGIAGKLRYTGYVVQEQADGAANDRAGGAGREEILVSAGGGAVGAPLLEAAIRARPLSAQRQRTWRLLAGDNLDAAAYAQLQALAAQRGEGKVQLERTRRDFTTLLANCAVSVSQAGYNTLIEAMQARARAVVVPFAGGHESEQTLRARCFAERGLLEMVEERALTPALLAAAVDRAALKPRPQLGAIGLDGARASAALVRDWTLP